MLRLGWVTIQEFSGNCQDMSWGRAQALTESHTAPPRFLLDANYAKPLRSNVGGSMFLSDDFGREGGGGIIVGGRVGRGGMQAWVGKALIGNVGGGDLRAVVTRTWNSPRGASANSTYVGGEVGWGLLVRLSVGFAKRIAGPATDDDTIITWGVGLEIPVWR